MGNTKKIAAFCCENSAYKAIDTLEDPSVIEKLEVIRVPCSGKVEIGLVLKCLENGNTGVLVLGCPTGNCKYISGNSRTRKRVAMVRERLKKAGIAENRVRMELVSSLDSHKITAIVKEMTQELT